MGKRVGWIWALRAAIVVVALFSLFKTVTFGKRQAGTDPRPQPSVTASPSPTPSLLGPLVTVPNLIGRETELARTTVVGIGLFPNLGTLEEPSRDLWSMVRGQDPEPGTRLPRGETVLLIVTDPRRPALRLDEITAGCNPGAQLEPSRILHESYQSPHIEMRAERGALDLINAQGAEGGFALDILWRPRSGYSGPFLIRGDALGAPGQIAFDQEPDIPPHGKPLLGTDRELHFGRGGAPDDFAWTTTITFPGPGCYGFQIDGRNFTEVLEVAVEL